MDASDPLQNMRVIRERYSVPLKLDDSRYDFLPSDIAEIRSDFVRILPVFDSICAGEPHADEVLLVVARTLPRVEHLLGHLTDFRDRATELLDADR